MLVPLMMILTIEIVHSQTSSVTNVEFDEFGNKYIRSTMTPESARTFTIDVHEDEYLYIHSSSTLHLNLTDISSNSSIESKVDSLSQRYFLLHPGNRHSLCDYNEPQCTVYLTATLKNDNDEDDDEHREAVAAQTQPVPVWIRFNRNIVARPFHSYSNTIQMRKRRRYGLEITSDDLPVLVQMTPNQDQRKMDIDLYGYTGTLSLCHSLTLSLCRSINSQRKSE